MEVAHGIMLVALCSIALGTLFIAVIAFLWYKERKKGMRLMDELENEIKVREHIIVKPVSRIEG